MYFSPNQIIVFAVCIAVCFLIGFLLVIPLKKRFNKRLKQSDKQGNNEVLEKPDIYIHSYPNSAKKVPDSNPKSKPTIIRLYPED